MGAAIGISGSYGGMNRGDEAILSAMLASLRGRLPDSTLTVFSLDAEDTRARHHPDHVVPVRTLDRDGAVPEVQRLDLLLLGGGGILYDSEADNYLREVAFAGQAGVPAMTYAIGSGPLDDPVERESVAQKLNAMQAVTVRDRDAKRILEGVGVEREVEVTADPTLLLRPEPFTEQQLRAEGLQRARPLVGMSIREPGKAAPDLDVDAYAAMLAQTADFVVTRYEADVLFIPMEKIDVRLSHMVMSRMTAAQHAYVLQRDYPSGVLLGLMQHVDLVIGARLHVLIFASISGTPFVPLPYASSVSAFGDAVGVEAPPPISRESAGALLATVDAAWERREEEARRLRDAVAPLRDRAQRTLDIALDCLGLGVTKS